MDEKARERKLLLNVLEWLGRLHESDKERPYSALLVKVQSESNIMSAIRAEASSLVVDQEEGLFAESINDRVAEFRRLLRLEPIQPVIPKPLVEMLDARYERIRELEARVDDLLRGKK